MPTINQIRLIEFSGNNWGTPQRKNAINKLETNYEEIISDLKKSLAFKENNFVGVCAYTYEKEATLTEN